MRILRLSDGPGAPQDFALDRLQPLPNTDGILIGRDERCCVVHLTHPYVSRRHAMIRLGVQGVLLTDEGSKAGTFVNGVRLKPHLPRVLRDNDHVQISGYSFQFRDVATGGDPSKTVELCADTGSGNTKHTEEASSPRAVRTDINTQSKLKALMQLTQDLRKIVSLDELLPSVLGSLLAMFAQADCGVIVLNDGSGGRPRRPLVRHRQAESPSDTVIQWSLVQAATDDRLPVMAANDLLMCVPLLDRDENPLGVIHLDAFQRQRRFTPEDLDLLTTVAFQVSFAVENALLHELAIRERSLEMELRIAQHIQVDLLPSQPPRIDGYEFYDYYAPAKFVGGDYYDYLPLDGGRLALVLGDVSGKGVPAALLMAKVSSELGACLAAEPDPVEALNQVNRRFSRRSPEGAFVTLVLAMLDLSRHALTIVNAGHIRPLLRRPDGIVVAIGDAEGGLPLGVEPEQTYERTPLELGVGDALLLVSDGMTDAFDARGERYGVSRLRGLLASAAGSATDIGRRIIGDIDQFVGDHPQSDDRCLLCLRRSA
jgi:serine phosphatase RsbU (regulator of sigma subunit)